MQNIWKFLIAPSSIDSRLSISAFLFILMNKSMKGYLIMIEFFESYSNLRPSGIISRYSLIFRFYYLKVNNWTESEKYRKLFYEEIWLTLRRFFPRRFIFFKYYILSMVPTVKIIYRTNEFGLYLFRIIKNIQLYRISLEKYLIDPNYSLLLNAKMTPLVSKWYEV